MNCIYCCFFRLKCDDIADQPFSLEIIEGTKKKNPSVPEHVPRNATLRHVLLHCCDIRTVPKKVLIPIIIHYVLLPSSFYRRQLKQVSCLTYDKLFPCHYRPQTKLREGNVFHRCLSVHRGGGYLWYQVPSLWLGIWGVGTHSQGWVCPGGGYWVPQIHGSWDTTGYGQQVGGTHPTGMFSCCWLVRVSLFIDLGFP